MSVRVEGPSECIDGGPPMNKAPLNSFATAFAALAPALATVPATAQGTRVGTLTCSISPGVDCRGTAATGLHLCIGERQGARGL